jgi:hypothetical protein
MIASNREAHLLDRVRDTAKRCIDLGVRVDIPGFNPSGAACIHAYDDFLRACEEALFQLAEVAGPGEMYTKDDVDGAYDEGYSTGARDGFSGGYDEGYEDGVAASAPE